MKRCSILNFTYFRFVQMDWDLCRTFNSVVATRSFLGAARLLGKSHPTVAREIAALENQLGTRLLVRSDEGLIPTAKGRRLHECTEMMGTAALRAEAEVAASGQSARGVVKLSIGPTLAAFWLMPHLKTFIMDHPLIEIDLVTHPFPASVRKREADIVLRVYQPGDENLTGRKIARLGVGFYASRDYAERRPLPERRDDWRDHSIIGFADKSTNFELGQWSDRITKGATVVMRCSSQADMVAAVRSGIGICVMSCVVGDAHADLIRVAPRKLVALSDVWLLAHPALVDQPPVRATMDFIIRRGRDDRALLRGRQA
jgi:DNA-binding transcriptional LysR family regulator